MPNGQIVMDECDGLDTCLTLKSQSKHLKTLHETCDRWPLFVEPKPVNIGKAPG